jgi:hypothetical protein
MDQWASVAVAVAAIGISALIVKKVLGGARPPPHSKDVLYLHQFSAWEFGPNASPPCMKAETFLRLAKIPYESRTDMKTCKTGTWPWAELNGETICDSQNIIETCTKHFNVQLGPKLTNHQQCVQTALRRVLEQSTYFHLVRDRWVDQFELLLKYYNIPGLPAIIKKLACGYFRKNIIKMLNLQGSGDMSQDEYHAAYVADVKCVAEFLGDQKYIFGDEVTELDCTVFAFLANIAVPEFPSPARDYVRGNKKLMAYIRRVADRAFPECEALKV